MTDDNEEEEEEKEVEVEEEEEEEVFLFGDFFGMVLGRFDLFVVVFLVTFAVVFAFVFPLILPLVSSSIPFVKPNSLSCIRKDSLECEH